MYNPKILNKLVLKKFKLNQCTHSCLKEHPIITEIAYIKPLAYE